MAANDEVMWFIRRNPGYTATQLAKQFGKKLSSLSSFLSKKASAGVLRREWGGPRGGYTYFWNVTNDPAVKSRDKTLWQHIMETD